MKHGELDQGCENSGFALPVQVDFLPAAALTPEELERQRQLIAEATKATRTVGFTLDGAPAEVRAQRFMFLDAGFSWHYV